MEYVTLSKMARVRNFAQTSRVLLDPERDIVIRYFYQSNGWQ
jgi:hypothetical protein